ncbi:uncharacterized protein LOC126095660 [Schistocerca cancellata]|uniref:uncharacterized protein LOC126095660 n=1 Tax=Schistocerca cancellata TaxID=274614 RepID=UPI002119AEB4|nr:uncharacterized protein LOC126095660 [Schistocerca cancellata]
MTSGAKQNFDTCFLSMQQWGQWASVASWFLRSDACTTAATTTTTGAFPAPTTTTNTTTTTASSTSGGPVAPSVCTAIRCTVANCSCECFTPGKMNIRYCDTCGHSWVPHALDKLGGRQQAPALPVEPVQANAAFDIASLVLYGCQALPIRLKILLDRLFSVLRRDEVLHVLAGFGWTHEDYARGYILQETHGATLERWHICSAEEEPLVLRQFLRFGETRAIALQLLAAAAAAASAPPPPPPPPPQRRPPGRPRRPSPPSRPPLTPPQPAGAPPLHRFSFLRLPPPPPPQLHPPPPVVSSSSSNGPLPRSPPGASSVSVSPLNRLQSMQPFDFRKLASPPEAASGRRRLSDAVSPPVPASMSASAPPPGLVGLGALALHPAACGGLPTLPPLPPPPPPPLPPPPPPADTKSPAAADVLSSGGGSSEFGSGTDDEEDSAHSALNLSRDGLYRRPGPPPLAPPPPPPPSLPPGLPHGLPPLTQLPPGATPRRGVPGRRHWGGDPHLPINLGTQLINPATGKKRVQCNVCLKTFCDKGALKIHFSAVHLREMHKCTVDGCNMMFSSRRSRNRHSANPNPKLHSPHLRRKISPHDGRSAHAHAHGHGLLVHPPPPPPPHPPPGALPLGPVFSPFPMLGPAAHLPKHSLDLTMHRFEESRRHDFGSSTLGSPPEDTGLRLSDHLPLPDDLSDDGYDDDDDGIVVDGGPDDDDDTDERESTDVEPQNLTQGHEDSQPEADGLSGDEQLQATEAKRPRLGGDVEADAEDEPSASNQGEASNDDSLSAVEAHNAKDAGEGAAGASKNPRTRKNRNPTRFALPAQTDSNHVSCDEDSSADSPFASAPPANDNGADDEEPARASGATHRTNGADPSPEATAHTESDGVVEKLPDDRSSENGPVDCTKQSSAVDSGEVCGNGEVEGGNAEETGSRELHCHAEKEQSTLQDGERNAEEEQATRKDDDKGGPVGCIKAERGEEREEQEEEDCHSSEGSMSSSTALQRLESLSQGPFCGPELNFSGCPSSPARSQGSSSNDSPGEDAHYFYPETGSFIGPMDVPIDKDNPRRCTACGKIFQNHFGVKTHFQNVHLKLMHKCTVEGCNAAFPSKRSRDRHSANLNLHRKLLSTSADSPGGSSPTASAAAAAAAAASFFMDKSSPLAASLVANPSLHGEFLARLYAESHALPLNLEAAFKGLPPLGHGGGPPTQQLVDRMLLNGDRLGPHPQQQQQQQQPPLMLPPLGFPAFSGHLLAAAAGVNGDAGDGGAAAASMSASPSAGGWSLEDDPPVADCDGRFPCAFCGQPLADASALKDHYECRHAVELARCATCGKLFTSGERLRQHADAAHGAAGPAGAAARLAACS